jgi:DNA-binding XRE family transcriptional regulator
MPEQNCPVLRWYYRKGENEARRPSNVAKRPTKSPVTSYSRVILLSSQSPLGRNAMRNKTYQPTPPIYLREHRRAKGFSQDKLAEIAQCTQGTVSFLEHSDRKPWPATLERIAAALETSPESLYFLPVQKAQGESERVS